LKHAQIAPDEISKSTRGRVQSVDQLTLGEELRLLKDIAWSRLKLPLDQAIFVRELQKVVDLRNAVAHFRTGPLTEADVSMLREFVEVLKKV
jgi:hypothetical protein